ncbi:NAD(P)(+) transhydrogenase (Re/Si-specific) subunit alpha, partial [Azospirillum brasilense]
VITTALIPGRKAPILVTREHVASMKPGSVLIDLAVEQGGNVEGSELGKVVTTENGVKIVGHANYPSRIAESASLLYAKNLLALLQALHDKDPEDSKKGRVTLNWDDEIVKAIALTRDGQVVHPAFADAVREVQTV